MESLENKYCRFCAEPKSSHKLINIDSNEKTCNEILSKLTFLNAVYVDVTGHDSLPKTICYVCYESLNKAYVFLDKVKKAQALLLSLFPKAYDTSYELSDDDRMTAFEEFLNSDSIDDVIPEVKLEKPSPQKQNVDVQVKIEPKEEGDAACILQEAIEGIQVCPSADSFDDSLNVQDILDAALCSDSNMKIYAKEVTNMCKKDIKTWNNYPWVCSYCNIEFVDVGTLRSHSKAAHGKCAAFTCIDCKGWKKEDFNSFVKHVRKHRKLLRNYCYYCNEPLNSETITVHLKKHFQRSQLSCASCGEILPNEASLTQHLRDFIAVKPKRKPRRKAGTPITVEDLTCEICKKVYKNPNSLRDHLKRHTDRMRNFTCDRCGKTFFNKGTLTSHIMAHDQIRPHMCRICNKSFLFPNMLRRHVEMHSGVKPFSCEQCGRCFRLQYQLNAHKIIHTNSMPHICQYCNKAFRFKQILKNHERQHTGAKPYCCQHCGMEFSNWSNYNKHMKRRHGTDTSKKKITPAGVFPINPETGQIIQVQDQGMEEWRNKIMIPAKRGKKKAIKVEDLTI